MGLFDSLFGSTREEVRPQEPLVTNIPTKTQEQQDFLKSLLGNLQGVTAQGGRPQAFGGQLSAPVSGLEQQAFGSIGDLFQSGGQTQNFIQSSLQPFNQQQTIDRFNQFQLPFAQQNQEESRRQLLERFAGTGGFDSGATTRAFADAETDFNLGLQSQLGNQLFAEQGRQDTRNVSGLNALLGIQQQGLGGGGVQRGIEQQGLDRILNEFISTERGVDPLLNLAGIGLGADTFTPLVQRTETGFGDSAASQIAQLLEGAGSFFS